MVFLILIGVIMGMIYVIKNPVEYVFVNAKPEVGIVFLSDIEDFSSEKVSPDRINAYRASKGLSKLVYNEGLFKSASTRASSIRWDKAPWSHLGWVRIMREYYGSYVVAGENLAKDFWDEADVVNAWKASPTHDKVLLDPRFCEYGYATKDGVYVFQGGCRE
jgi:uncharacterized protein YkwD